MKDFVKRYFVLYRKEKRREIKKKHRKREAKNEIGINTLFYYFIPLFQKKYWESAKNDLKKNLLLDDYDEDFYYSAAVMK